MTTKSVGGATTPQKVGDIFFSCQNIIGKRIITLDMSYRRDIIQRNRVVKNPIVFSMIMNIKGVL